MMMTWHRHLAPPARHVGLATKTPAAVSAVLHLQWATTHFTLECKLLPDATHINATSLVIYEAAGTTVTSSPIAVLKGCAAGSYKPAIGTAWAAFRCVGDNFDCSAVNVIFLRISKRLKHAHAQHSYNVHIYNTSRLTHLLHVPERTAA